MLLLISSPSSSNLVVEMNYSTMRVRFRNSLAELNVSMRLQSDGG